MPLKSLPERLLARPEDKVPAMNAGVNAAAVYLATHLGSIQTLRRRADC